MEPCVDPAFEVQAAGRIHRLGQSKDVLVKRLCFRNSYEEQVVKLHADIAQGKCVGIVDGRLSGELFTMLSSK